MSDMAASNSVARISLSPNYSLMVFIPFFGVRNVSMGKFEGKTVWLFDSCQLQWWVFGWRKRTSNKKPLINLSSTWRWWMLVGLSKMSKAVFSKRNWCGSLPNRKLRVSDSSAQSTVPDLIGLASRIKIWTEQQHAKKKAKQTAHCQINSIDSNHGN